MGVHKFSELLAAQPQDVQERVEARVTEVKAGMGYSTAEGIRDLREDPWFDPKPPRPSGVVYRIGDKVRLVVPRSVVKIGYRKTWLDYQEEAKASILGVQGESKAFRQLCGSQPSREMVRAFAMILADRDGLGGPERGVHFEPRHLREDVIVGKRNARIGRYYPPSGGYNAYTMESDYEDGGLADSYTVVVLRLASGVEVLSSDVELVEDSPDTGTDP